MGQRPKSPRDLTRISSTPNVAQRDEPRSKEGAGVCPIALGITYRSLSSWIAGHSLGGGNDDLVMRVFSTHENLALTPVRDKFSF